MRDGFIRVASVSPDIRVCDVDYNKESIIMEGMSYKNINSRFSKALFSINESRSFV